MQIGAIGNYSTGMLQISNNKLSPVQSFMSKQENNTEKGKSLNTTKYIAGATVLTALATIGIYALTKKSSKISLKNKGDIVEEFISPFGTKQKLIKDRNNSNLKEHISYFENGKEKYHVYYDSSIKGKDEDRLLKEVLFEEDGELCSETLYSKPGIKYKYIHYIPSDEAQKIGRKIASGTKYYPNGKPRFKFAHISGMSTGLARLLDTNGNVIKERILTGNYIIEGKVFKPSDFSF